MRGVLQRDFEPTTIEEEEAANEIKKTRRAISHLYDIRLLFQLAAIRIALPTHNFNSESYFEMFMYMISRQTLTELSKFRDDLKKEQLSRTWQKKLEVACARRVQDLINAHNTSTRRPSSRMQHMQHHLAKTNLHSNPQSDHTTNRPRRCTICEPIAEDYQLKTF